MNLPRTAVRAIIAIMFSGALIAAVLGIGEDVSGERIGILTGITGIIVTWYFEDTRNGNG